MYRVTTDDQLYVVSIGSFDELVRDCVVSLVIFYLLLYTAHGASSPELPHLQDLRANSFSG
jgi:hypothetical protein